MLDKNYCHFRKSIILRSLAFDNDHDLSWPEQAFQPFSESRTVCSGNMSYDISRLTCSLCPVNSIPNSNGKDTKTLRFTYLIGFFIHFKVCLHLSFFIYFQVLVVGVHWDGESFKMLDIIEEVVAVMILYSNAR